MFSNMLFSYDFPFQSTQRGNSSVSNKLRDVIDTEESELSSKPRTSIHTIVYSWFEVEFEYWKLCEPPFFKKKDKTFETLMTLIQCIIFTKFKPFSKILHVMNKEFRRVLTMSIYGYKLQSKGGIISTIQKLFFNR